MFFLISFSFKCSKLDSDKTPIFKRDLQTNSTSSLISRSIKSGYMVNNKYFSFENKKNYSIAKSEYIKNLPVHQYSLSGEYIKSFKNKAEAVKEIKIKNLNIGAAIKLNHSAGGF